MRPKKFFNNTSLKKRRLTATKKAYDKETAAECKQALERFLFGTLGAASPVRRIDPKTGKVVAVLDPMAHAKGMRQTEWNRAGLVMLHQYAH
jgi:hypothetical protein